VAAEPNLMAMANELKTEIERRIWTKALILMVRSADWAKTAG
jgi:predicted nucleic acid-binding Zn ribbon protein